MYTQCPFCHTAYEPTPSQLAQARGRLLCVVCAREFDGLDRLSERAPAGAAPRPARLPESAAPAEQGDLFGLPEPTFAQALAKPPRRWPWWLGSAALAVCLLLQIGLAERERLAAQPAWRPLVERLSAAAGLPLAPLREPASLRLLARDVRPHPSVPDALLVSASFRNEAARPQAWPLLELALADIDGRPLALRRFRAEEYLGTPPEQASLAPGQAVAANLELVDPGKDAIAFSFEFR